MRYLLAVDPSLTCSGWAIFSIQPAKLCAVGKIKSLPATTPLPTRYDDLQKQIAQIFNYFELGNLDIVICEAQTTMRDPRAAFKVEQVRGIFETLGRERACRVPGRLNPRTIQYEAMGLRGKQLKREIVKATAVATVKSLYQKDLESFGLGSEKSTVTSEDLKRHQDIVDAILIGHVAVSRLKTAIQTGVSVESCF